MITTTNLGNGGRLCNQIFHYASLIGLAKKHKRPIVIPEWKYAKYFKGNYPHGECHIDYIHTDQQYHYSDCSFLSSERNLKHNFALNGYFQSYKYFENAKDEVKKALAFTTEFKKHCKEGYDFSKPVIAIHIRRGDYITTHSEYYLQLPITYFYNALTQFKDWRKHNIIIFSDDIPYCKLHFACLENVQFATGNEIEDLCLMSQCQKFVLSNSTFAWWGAYLSGSKHVIRPDGLFAGEYAKKNNDKDFWPSKWVAIAPNQKLDLTDVTFTIPVYWDHPDRQQNLNLCVCLIQHYCNTNIIICEHKNTEFGYMAQWCNYLQSDYKVFHRTKMLNDMAKLATTPIIFNWDADVIISPIQVLQAVEKLRNGAELCFPYDGRFARIDRRDWFKHLEKSLDVGSLAGQQFPGMEETAAVSLGGAIGYRKDDYLAIGGENEKFISFGAEDVERIIRAKKLGLKVERVKGAMYHISHWCGVNSSTANPYFHLNREEFNKVDKMSKAELIDYISTWNK